MNSCPLILAGETLHAFGSGALWWPARRILVVSDLHMGKSERMARRGGSLLPPYEVEETLMRLAGDIASAMPDRVVCLGDSLDDDAARQGLSERALATIAELQSGRDWIWVSGNHDPAPSDLGGTAAVETVVGGLTFRHVAEADGAAEISGHFHPKARLALRGRTLSRRCFLADARRIVMPAYGTYTGGLDWRDAVFRGLFPTGCSAVLTGETPRRIILPQPAPARRKLRT